MGQRRKKQVVSFPYIVHCESRFLKLKKKYFLGIVLFFSRIRSSPAIRHNFCALDLVCSCGLNHVPPLMLIVMAKGMSNAVIPVS